MSQLLTEVDPECPHQLGALFLENGFSSHLIKMYQVSTFCVLNMLCKHSTLELYPSPLKTPYQVFSFGPPASSQS